MGKRGRPLKNMSYKEDEEEEEGYKPPHSVLRQLVHQPPPNSSSPPDPQSTRTRRQKQAFLARCGITTPQTPLNLTSALMNVNSVVPCASSASSPQGGLLTMEVDQAGTSSKFPHAQSSQAAVASTPPPQKIPDDANNNKEQSLQAAAFSSPPPQKNLGVGDNEKDESTQAAISTPPPQKIPDDANNKEQSLQAAAFSTPPPQKNLGVGDNEKDQSTQAAVSTPPPQRNSPSLSNCTEIAAMVVANDYLDNAEVTSKSYPKPLVHVNGYRVKEEVAPLLRSIISKYGDIGKECPFQSHLCRSSFMEQVCEIYRNLEHADFTVVTKVDLKLKLMVVEDLECNAKINLGWLRKRLDEMIEALESSKGYIALKDELASKEMEIMRKKKEMQAELDKMEGDRDKVFEALMICKAKMTSCFKRSFVNGLL